MRLQSTAWYTAKWLVPSNSILPCGWELWQRWQLTATRGVQVSDLRFEKYLNCACRSPASGLRTVLCVNGWAFWDLPSWVEGENSGSANCPELLHSWSAWEKRQSWKVALPNRLHDSHDLFHQWNVWNQQWLHPLSSVLNYGKYHHAFICQ